MLYDIDSSPLVTENRAVRQKRPMTTVLFSFLLLLLVISFITSIPSFFYLFVAICFDSNLYFTILSGNVEAGSQLLLELYATQGYLLTMLLSQALAIACALLFTAFIAKRRSSLLGFRSKNAVFFYLAGLLCGVVLFGLSLLIATFNQSVTLQANANPNVAWILLFLLGFIVQGASEEILFRGVLMSSLLETRSPIYAILVNSVLFSVMHTGNMGFSLLPLLNIFLFGVLLSIITIRCGSIFPALAIHSAWNFAEGCLFGSSVSGMPAMPSLFVSKIDEAKWLTNGGAFGPEGGIAVSLVLLLALLLICLLPSKRKKQA